MIRPIAITAALVMLLVSANPVAAGADHTVNIPGPANAFVPATLTIDFGQTVQWSNNDTQDHTSTADLFDLWHRDLNNPPTTSASVLFARAGTFNYHCELHGGMDGSIKVRMSASDTTPSTGQQITITFASSNAPAGFTEQIGKRKAGGTWKIWRTSTGTSTSWTPQKVGTFQFRARLRRTSDGVSTPYSPFLVITVS